MEDIIKIGNVKITGKAALAPMAGVSDYAYREICMEMGAAYSVTEMVSSKAIQYGHRKSAEIAKLSKGSRSAAIQIFGEDPVVMALAAKKLMEYDPDVFDINMGCPVPKVAGAGSGSALMRRPDVCGAIVSSVKQAVGIPVTVKIRKGWDQEHVNAVEVARICEQAGASAICVHGRTKTQMYTGEADWDIIRQVKQAVNVPVIGNGDVTGPEQAAKMLEMTGCDLVMVGRGAQGNPWIFSGINEYLSRGVMLPPPSLSERTKMIHKHIVKMCEDKGEERAMREARRHVAWYLHGMHGAAGFRRRAGMLASLEDLDDLLEDLYKENIPVECEDQNRAQEAGVI